MLGWALQYFEPYWRKRELALMRRECEQLRKALDEFLEDVLEEQQEHLRVMRRSGPWSADWELASRQREQLARKVLRRLRRYRGLQERLRRMEAELPSCRGLDRLRYHPWGALWVLFTLGIVAWARVLA
ncbi:MAG: hypothetical protein ABIL09_19095 [Gemmatimonadota bacterium]